MSESKSTGGGLRIYVILIVVIAAATAGVTALLLNVAERKAEARTPFVRLVEVGEDTTDPAEWGKNWPKQYDTYQLTALPTQTRLGGHGGREAMNIQ
jgi:nitrite reductase (cytochrome c-552)